MNNADCDETECQDCGEELLTPGVVYADGQRLICPTCGAIHFVCCDNEGMHLHGPADEV